jgi:hypothetical protein
VFGARFAVFVRRARVLPGPCPATRNLWFLRLFGHRDGDGETSRTKITMGWATRAPVAQTPQSVRKTCPYTMTACLYPFVRFPSSGTFKPTRTIPINN